MNYLIEFWLIEVVKSIVKIFYNPLFYWFFIFIFIVSLRRIRREREIFGIKIFNMFAEWKGTILISLFSGLVLSFVTIGMGFVFNYDLIFILAISTILVSLTFNTHYLSAVYTIGLTYMIMLFLPIFEGKFNLSIILPTNTQFTQLSVLLGLFLIIEAILIRRLKINQISPDLELSNRGVWVGGLDVNKATMIPLFIFIPSNSLGLISDFWPYFNIGETQYSLLLIPFLIGFNYQITSEHLYEAKEKIGKKTFFLGVFITILAVASIYIPVLSFIAIIVALIGKEFISIHYKMSSKKKNNYYGPLNKGLRILAILPGSPADRLNLYVGETIVKINNEDINNKEDFYRALQHKSASFRLNVLNKDGEVRFVSGSRYEQEDHNLGLIFPGKPHNK